LSAFDDWTSNSELQEPDTLLTDPATGAVGWSNPTLDSGGNAYAEWDAIVGDTMILAGEYTAATPDPLPPRNCCCSSTTASRTAREPGRSQTYCPTPD
jgi:hypothetical protein